MIKSTRGRKPNTTKTRSKKTFPVIASVTVDSIDGKFETQNKPPLIIHLPIKSCDVVFHDNSIKYDPTPPLQIEAYDKDADNQFTEQNVCIEAPTCPEQNDECKQVNNSADIICNNTNTFLAQFKNTKEISKLPEQTDVYCMWCCNPFQGMPFIIPIHDRCEYIEVYGNFCCSECATSYIFDMKQDFHKKWDQYSLLNRIYKKKDGTNIRPAPPRTCLKIFGGSLTIEEYRKIIHNNNSRVDIHLPPMISILSTMDIKPIDFYDVNLTKNMSEDIHERIDQIETKLKLERKKPLKEWNSTLDACIKLKVNTCK